MTREEWQAGQDVERERTGAWGFDPMMPWGVANWRERAGIGLFYAIAWGVVFPVCLVGILFVIGTMIEGIGRHNAEHDRCLKNATNGYEIKQCR